MNKERSQEVMGLLEEYMSNHGKQIIGESKDPTFKEENGYSLRLSKDSNTVKDLEARGFKVIYPAKLKDEFEQPNGQGEFIKGKYLNEQFKDNAFIIDSSEKPSLDLANAIARHYFLEGENGHILTGMDAKSNAMTFFTHGSGYIDGANQDFSELLNGMGFETQIDEYGRVTASSNIPYPAPAIQKSKFEQIYDKARGKIKDMFSKIKSIAHSKEQKQNNDKDMDER